MPVFNGPRPDLTNKDGTFASLVVANSRTLTGLINDDHVSCDELKEFVLELLDNCNQTPWVKNARQNVQDKKDKTDLAFYVYNSMLSGAGLKSMK